jgi:hypothetical protein
VKANLNDLSNAPLDLSVPLDLTVGFPKNTGLFGGIADIHAFHQRTPFYFNRLAKNQACNNR